MTIDVTALRDLVSRHGEVTRITVVSAKGSVPRGVGTSMMVWHDGQSGTIGGGRLEFEATERAKKTSFASGQVHHVPLGPALGQCCGGSVALLFEQVNDDFFRGLNSSYRLTRLSGDNDAPMSLQRTVKQHRSEGAPVRTVFQDGWILEPVQALKLDVRIYGAGHVGRALIGVLAPLPDLNITWIDTALDRYPDSIPPYVLQLVAQKPADTVRQSPVNAHHYVLTYAHALDLEICHQLLGHGFGYAGLIGSKTKWARFRSRLTSLGHNRDAILRIDCPIGDPKLGKHPQAIAVGVAAKLLSRAGTIESMNRDVG